MKVELIRALEADSLSAWPAHRQVPLDGWIMRFSGGYTRRANSVNPLYPGQLPVEERIRAAESAYADAGLPPVFKLTAACEPSDLDTILADRGYRAEARTSVQSVSLAHGSFDPQPPQRIRSWPKPSDQWLAVYSRFNRVSEHNQVHLRRIVEAIEHRCHFVLLLDSASAKPIACGLVVHQATHAWLFDIATDPTQRRKGNGQRLMHHLLHRSAAAGAQAAYLQVTVENAPAIALYEKLGFAEHHQYWYRTTA